MKQINKLKGVAEISYNQLMLMSSTRKEWRTLSAQKDKENNGELKTNDIRANLICLSYFKKYLLTFRKK